MKMQFNVNRVKVVYRDSNDNNREYILGYVDTNRSMTTDEYLQSIGIDMDKWAESQGWDDYNFEDVYTEFVDE